MGPKGSFVDCILHQDFGKTTMIHFFLVTFSGNAFKMSSSNRTSKRHSRENWAEEVIAAAMKTGSNEGNIEKQG